MTSSLKSFLSSRTTHSALGFAVSAGLLLWMFLSVDWHGVGDELKKFQWWALIPCLAVLVGHFYLRALRWRYLLPGTHDVSLQRLFDALIVGALATFILPLRAGEIIRPYMLTRYSPYRFSTAFVSVIVERFFDLAVVLGSFAVVVVYVPGVPEWVRAGTVILSGLAVAIFVLMFVASLAPALVLNTAEFFFRFLPQRVGDFGRRFLAEFLEGAAVLKRGGRLALVVLFSLLIWGSCYFQFVTYFWLVGMEGDLVVATCVAVIIALAVAAPSAPGFIGVYQLATIAGFRLFGLSEQQAVAYSIVNHLLQYVFFVVYGMIVLTRSHLKLTDLQSQSLNAGERASMGSGS